MRAVRAALVAGAIFAAAGCGRPEPETRRVQSPEASEPDPVVAAADGGESERFIEDFAEAWREFAKGGAAEDVGAFLGEDFVVVLAGGEAIGKADWLERLKQLQEGDETKSLAVEVIDDEPVQLTSHRLRFTTSDGTFRLTTYVRVDGAGKRTVVMQTTEQLDAVESGTPELSANAASEENLKQLGLVCKMYAAENTGEYYPPLSPKPGRLMMSAQAVYPEYLPDPSVLYDPQRGPAPVLSIPEDLDAAFDDHSYYYFPHAFRDLGGALAWAAAYRKAAQEGRDFNVDLESGTAVGTIYRTREGIERVLATDPNDAGEIGASRSRIVLMMERPIEPNVSDIDVLYLDGHVETVRPGRFPNTEAFLAALEGIDAVEQAP